MDRLQERSAEAALEMKHLMEARLEGRISAREFEIRLRRISEQTERTALETLSEAADERAPEATDCSDPRCPGRMNQTHDIRPKTLQTAAGKVRLADRRFYVCRQCGRSWAPADEALGVVAGGLTIRAAEKICHHGAHDGGYGQASRGLAISADLDVSPKQIQRIVGRVGLQLDQMREQEVNEVVVRDPAPAYRAAALSVAVDGSMIRFRDKPDDAASSWGEVKSAVVSAYLPMREGASPPVERGRVYRPENLRQHYTATRQRPDLLQHQIVGQLCREGVKDAAHVTFVSDGAEWIEKLYEQLVERFEGVRFHRVLDWTHARQRLGQIAQTCFKEACEAMAWREACCDDLWHQRLDKVFERIDLLIEQLGSPPAGASAEDPREVLRVNRQYLARRRSQLRYVDFRRLGIPIGSGTVESACRVIVGDRLKAAAKRWNQNGAEAVLLLRTLAANEGQWALFWDAPDQMAGIIP